MKKHFLALGLLVGSLLIAPKAMAESPKPHCLTEASIANDCYPTVQLVIELRIKVSSGYNPKGNHLVVRNRNGDVLLKSPVVTSRLGVPEQLLTTRIGHLMTDPKGITGYPVFSLEGLSGYGSDDYVGIHGYLGNERFIAGSEACIRTFRFADLSRMIESAHQQGGHVAFFVTHH